MNSSLLPFPFLWQLVAVAWELSYQLVFGRNPNSPGNSHNKLPALTSETASQVVADHLNSLREARHAYIKAESSNRIARALRGRVFEGTHKRFCVGDTVYYKRLNKKIWQGPGKVIAQDTPAELVNNINAKNAYFGESFSFK